MSSDLWGNHEHVYRQVVNIVTSCSTKIMEHQNVSDMNIFYMYLEKY